MARQIRQRVGRNLGLLKLTRTSVSLSFNYFGNFAYSMLISLQIFYHPYEFRSLIRYLFRLLGTKITFMTIIPLTMRRVHQQRLRYSQLTQN